MNDSKFVKTKHWLFDFDGTLVDSMPSWSAAMVGILDRYGVPHGDDIVNIITPLGTHGTLEYFQKIGLKISIEEMGQEIRSELTPKYVNFILDKPGVRHCLERMKSAGYKLHVLTASPHIWLDACLKRLGLFGLFENVWSSDDFGMGKSKPEIYAKVAERLGTPIEEITFLDDNIGADTAAKTAGVKVVAVYDETSKNDEMRMRQAFDGYVMDFAELEENLFS